MSKTLKGYDVFYKILPPETATIYHYSAEEARKVVEKDLEGYGEIIEVREITKEQSQIGSPYADELLQRLRELAKITRKRTSDVYQLEAIDNLLRELE